MRGFDIAESEVRAFFDKVAKDEVLRKKLAEAEKNAGSMNELEPRKLFDDKILPIVKEQGFNFTYDDLLEYKKGLEPKEGQEFSGNFLAHAAGGQAVAYKCIKEGDSRASKYCGFIFGGDSTSSSGCGLIQNTQICGCINGGDIKRKRVLD